MAILGLLVFVGNTLMLVCLWRAHKQDLVHKDEEYKELMG